jgi:5-methyltetrahydrofolate--homocysteine methyltransferase
METIPEISRVLQEGDDEKVVELTRTALGQRVPARDILRDGLIAGMAVIGEKFRDHEIFLPDVLLAAKAMHAGLAELKPHLVGEKIPTAGRIVLGTVQGDLHDIGKNLVGIILGGAGFEIIDLGHDVPPDKFVETAVREHADFIGMSALLTTTMPVMKRVIGLLREQGLAGRIRTIVGGAPVTETWAREIGADAYAFDANDAVERLKSLVPTRPT